MGLVPLRDLPKPKLPKLREPERSRRDLEKGRKSRNAIYRGAKKKREKKRQNVRRCERVGRRKIESGARVSKLQILRKSRARDTQRHLAPGRMHLTAQTMRHRRARRGYIRAARRWVTGVGVHYNQIPEKGGKRIKKAICRDNKNEDESNVHARARARARAHRGKGAP